MNNKISRKALLKKDLKVFFINKQFVAAIIILAVVFCIFYPLMMGIGISSGEEIVEGVELKVSDVFSIFSVFLLIMPLMLGNLFGNGVIIYEKENKTLETILYCPMSTKDLIKTKILVLLFPGIGITYGCFFLSIISLNLGLSSFVLPSLSSWITCLLFAPGVLFLSLLFTIYYSVKSENSVQAQQKSIVFLLPLILIVMVLAGILSGVSIASQIGGIVFSIVLTLVSYLIGFFMFKKVYSKFTAEFLLNSSDK